MSDPSAYQYLLALGSNMRSARLGNPQAVCVAAIAALDTGPCRLLASSAIITSLPIGPSQRRYANAAAMIECALSPQELLRHVQKIENSLGRTRAQRRGQRWRARVIDIDLIMWSGGAWKSEGLCIPHREYTDRLFVLEPAAHIAGDWRDPASGLSVRHLRARKAKPIQQTPRLKRQMVS